MDPKDDQKERGDPREPKAWMMKLLHEYGRQYLVFDPEDQPNVFAAPEPEYRELKSGNMDPRELKSWRYFDFTLKVLQDRYGLFGDGHLVIDCPVHRIHPLEGERPEDFRECFQLTAEGTIRFRCRRSIGCLRRHCALKKSRSIDLYDLIALLDKKGREYARKVISSYCEAELGRKLGHFQKTQGTEEGSTEKEGVVRYAVPKDGLLKLFSIPMKGRGASERFIAKAVELIRRSEQMPYDGHRSDLGDLILFSKNFDWDERLEEFGPAARLFLWLHWKQAESGAALKVQVPQVAVQIGMDERTVQKHKAILQSLGYIRVVSVGDREYLWTASYNPGTGTAEE